LEDTTIAHSIILIRTKINALKGAATNGRLHSLLEAVEAAHSVLENGEPTNAQEIHDALHDLEDSLTDWVDAAEAADTALRGMVE
jgi:hypothetical protein